MLSRRKILKTGAVAGAAAGAAVVGAPAIHAKSKIRWRMQTYAGPALAEHVVKPAIESFNKVAGDEMEIELYFADQLVPTGELFRALQKSRRRDGAADDGDPPQDGGGGARALVAGGGARQPPRRRPRGQHRRRRRRGRRRRRRRVRGEARAEADPRPGGREGEARPARRPTICAPRALISTDAPTARDAVAGV